MYLLLQYRSLKIVGINIKYLMNKSYQNSAGARFFYLVLVLDMFFSRNIFLEMETLTFVYV